MRKVRYGECQFRHITVPYPGVPAEDERSLHLPVFAIVSERSQLADFFGQKYLLEHDIRIIDNVDILTRFLAHESLLYCIGNHFLEPIIIFSRPLTSAFLPKIVGEAHYYIRYDGIHWQNGSIF